MTKRVIYNQNGFPGATGVVVQASLFRQPTQALEEELRQKMEKVKACGSFFFPKWKPSWVFPTIGGVYPQNGWFISWKTLLK